MPSPYIKSGSYVGDGTDNRNISVGFDITTESVVILKGQTTEHCVFRTSAHVGDKTSFFVNAAADAADYIQSFGSDGFQVGVAANTNGVTYHWTVFVDNGSGEVKVGSYTGNGADNRDITGVGFSPLFLMVKNDGANAICLRDSLDAGDATHLLSGNSNVTDHIQALNADGFQVGTSSRVNTNASTYHYFAFKTSTMFKIDTYTGNGSDNRNITGVGFQPNFLHIKRDGASSAVWKTSTLTGDLAAFYSNIAAVADTIQNLDVDGFQVGTGANVNTAANAYHYFAAKENLPAVAPSSVNNLMLLGA